MTTMEPRFPGAASVLAAWLVLWACAATAAARPNRPAAGDGSVISLPEPTTRQVKTIAQRVALTEQEKTVLGDLQDGTDKFDETALYVMFAIAARMPKLDVLEWDQLDRPAYVNLLADPDRYRATPLRMRVKVYYVAKLQSGAGLDFSKFWPKDRPVWEMDCVQSDTPFQKNKPLRIYSVVDPTPQIGQPDEIGPHNRRKYDRGRDVRIAALFYKIYRTREEGTGRLRDYPEAMAWQMSRTISSIRVGGWDAGKLSQLLPLALLLVVLAAGFYLTRRRLAKLKAEGVAGPRYRPLRRESSSGSEESPQAQATGERPAEPKADDVPVDPALTAAVEEYLQEKGDDDGADPRG